MEIILRFVAMILKVLNIISTPFMIISSRYFYRPIKVPPIENSLLRIAAIDLAEKIRNKEVSALYCEEMIFVFDFFPSNNNNHSI